MIKDLAWNTFKKTGNVNTFLELKQLENMQNENQIMNQKVNLNEHCENEGNNNCGK